MKDNSNFKFDENQKQPQGFSVPENYFGSIENAVFAKIAETNLPKENGFTTPTNYFDTLDTSIYKIGRAHV